MKKKMKDMENEEELIDTKLKKGKSEAKDESGYFTEENPDNKPPSVIIVDGRIIEVPPKLKEIRIKRCKKITLPIMTFMPIFNENIPNSRN